MPWKPTDASRHTRKADTPEKAKQWSDITNSVLESGESDASAIRIANSQVKRHPSQPRRYRTPEKN